VKTGSSLRTLLISGHDLRFLRPFIGHCVRGAGYRVLLDEHDGHDITNTERARHLLRSADIIFCEWCLGNAVWYSQNKSPGQKLVIRLHEQEMRLPYLDQVQWHRVDALIVVCPHNQNRLRERYPFLSRKVHLIYNPVDCRALSQLKLPGAQFNLGLLGLCPKRKAPHVALQLFSRLKNRDSRYTLFIKGKPPRDYDWLWGRPEERSYYEALFANLERAPYADSVVFEPYGEDIPLWFSKIGFVLSTSDSEGSHQAVAEGMASGALPLIRDWAGAASLYPPRFVFSTVDEAVGLATNFLRAENYPREVEAVKRFAASTFDQGKIARRLNRLLTTLDSAAESPPSRMEAASLG
jgi:glycosyltransferase involved in cell wall biosynthesis